MKERIEGEYPMKKWIGRMAVLLAFILTLSGSTLAAFGEIPSATEEFYVNDYGLCRGFQRYLEGRALQGW